MWHTKMHFLVKCNSGRFAIQWFHVKHHLDYQYTKFQPYTYRVQKMCVFARYATLVPRLYIVIKVENGLHLHFKIFLNKSDRKTTTKIIIKMLMILDFKILSLWFVLEYWWYNTLTRENKWFLKVLAKSNFATPTPFGSVSCFVVGACLSNYNLISFLIHEASYSNGYQWYLMHRKFGKHVKNRQLFYPWCCCFCCSSSRSSSSSSGSVVVV